MKVHPVISAVKVLLIISLTTVLQACFSIKQIADLNMVSKRNVDMSKEYGLIATYARKTKKQLKKAKSPNIQEAVDLVVKSVPGGEFLMNVKIYQVNGRYFAVEGDVYGVKGSAPDYKGIKVGDAVTWKTALGYKTGKVIAIDNNLNFLVEESESGKTKKFKAEELSLINE
jgi:hypothetical protein